MVEDADAGGEWCSAASSRHRVLTDRVNPPRRFTPLEAALNPLLPGKSKASVCVGNLNFSSRKSKGKEKISTQISTCRWLASVFLLAVCLQQEPRLCKSSRWVVWATDGFLSCNICHCFCQGTFWKTRMGGGSARCSGQNPIWIIAFCLPKIVMACLCFPSP